MKTYDTNSSKRIEAGKLLSSVAIFYKRTGIRYFWYSEIQTTVLNDDKTLDNTASQNINVYHTAIMFASLQVKS